MSRPGIRPGIRSGGVSPAKVEARIGRTIPWLARSLLAGAFALHAATPHTAAAAAGGVSIAPPATRAIAADRGTAGSPPPERATAAAVRVDALGDTLTVGRRPDRIVSLSPSVTEILFALGVAQERIVGVTRFCDFPSEARTLPRIGGIIDPSLEAIVLARPELVLAVRGTPIEQIRRMRQLGLSVFAIDDQAGLGEIEEILGQVLELTGSDDSLRAGALIASYRNGLPAYRRWSASIPRSALPRVLYCDPAHPGWSAGPGSHIDDLIGLAGGTNAIGGTIAWPQLSAEQVATLVPDRLLLAWNEGSDRETVRAELARQPGWKGSAALRDGRICWVDAGVLMRPGPRTLQALRELAACLHPERAQPEETDGALPPGRIAP